MPTLTLDEVTHEYKLDGQHIPGVSELIDQAGLMPPMEWIREEQLRTGEYVHKTIELFLKDDLNEDYLDPVLKVRLDGFKLFLKETGYQVQRHADGTPVVEVKMFHPVYRYGGRFDQLGIHAGQPMVLDLKSGAPDKWHRVQTALYSMLFTHRPARACLYLPRTGGYRFVSHHERSDFDVAKAVLTLAAFKDAA